MNNFEDLHKKIEKISKNKQIDCFVYGKSYLGQNLYAFHKGSYNTKQILITGGIHAREYISSYVVIKLLEDYKEDMGVYFLPVLNIDGIRLSMDGLSFIKDEDTKKMILRLNNNSTNFELWKANAIGVDLNVNFDAMWGQSKFTTDLPSAYGYLGENCNEYENSALINYIKDKNIKLSLSYHSKGRVVYYGFCKQIKTVKNKTKKLAYSVGRILKYKPLKSKGSSGGLSDYLSFKYNIPSVTIELGDDKLKHPISLKYFDEIYTNQYEVLKHIVENFERYDI